MKQETKFSSQQESVRPIMVVSPKHKKIGLFLLIGPFAGLISVLIIFFIVNFIVGGETNSDAPSIAISIIQLVLTFIGIICVLGLIIGIPLGLIFMNKKILADNLKYDERSGKKEASIVPNEIKNWNWGAAGLTWIWGVYHGVWISLLVLIPIVNIVMIIVLGIKGNEWAWRSQKWESVENFVSYQNKWKPWGMAFLILTCLGLLSNFLKD